MRRFWKIIVIVAFSLVLWGYFINLERSPAQSLTPENLQTRNAPLVKASNLVSQADQPVSYENVLSRQQLENATYKLLGFSHLDPIKLTDGLFHNAERSITITYLRSAPLSDVNGDGTIDSYALLGLSGGGSGTIVQLAIVLNEAGQPINEAVVSLGDRTKVIDVMLDSKKQIVVQTLSHRESDTMLYPTLPLQYVYGLYGDRFSLESLTKLTECPWFPAPE